MNIVGIGGPPGVGKSEVMREVLALLREQGFEREDVKGTIQVDGRNVTLNAVELRAHGVTVVVLGRYDEGDTFPGTDRLSMAAQPAAEHLIELLAQWEDDRRVENPRPRVHVLFEGDRLFSRSFLISCARAATVHAVVLSAHPDVIHQRRAERGSTQDASWLKGRASKVEGIVHWLKDAGEPVHELINAPGLARECAAHVLDLLGLGEPIVCERCQDEGCAEGRGTA